MKRENLILRVVICALLAVIAAIVVDMAALAEHRIDLHEGGGLEQLTLLFYLVALGGYFGLMPAGGRRRFWPVPVLLVLFTLRELDFDKAFTEDGILSSGHYAGDASLLAKAAGLGVVLLVLVALGRLVWIGAGPLLRGVRRGQGAAFAALAAVLLLVVTKSIDGLARKLAPLGVTPGQGTQNVALLLEELGEAMIPVTILLAVLSVWRQEVTLRKAGQSL